MATYVTSYGKGMSWQIVPDAGIEEVPMKSELVRSFTNFSGSKYVIQGIHWWIEQADLDTIIAFYNANKILEVTVPTDEGDFLAYFKNEPYPVEKSGVYRKVIAEFTGVRAP